MVKVGSRVKFLSDTGVGVVRSIRGNMAYVDVDGFEIPALLSDVVEVELEHENEAIVRIGPDDPKYRPQASTPKGAEQGGVRVTQPRGVGQYGRVAVAKEWEDEEVDEIDMAAIRRNYNKRVQAQAESAQQEQPLVVELAPFEVTDFDLKLLFVPVKGKGGQEKVDMEADLEMFIVNDSSYQVYYNVAQWAVGYVTTLRSGLLEADTKESVRVFSRMSLAQIMTLHVSVLPFKATSFVPQRVENFDIELHPLKFVRPSSYAENPYSDQKSVVFTLASSSPETMPDLLGQQAVLASVEAEVKREDRMSGKPQTKKVADREIVDLHAEAFLDDFQTMGNGEVLQAQLARFTIALDGAIEAGRHTKMVFIHGVGKGKLKYEMKKLLDRKYSKYRYQDASFAEYGYGAIMVFV